MDCYNIFKLFNFINDLRSLFRFAFFSFLGKDTKDV